MKTFKIAAMIVFFLVVVGIPAGGLTYCLQSWHGAPGGILGVVLGLCWGIFVARLAGEIL